MTGAARNRFHKGLSTVLRQALRREGLSLDEEMAQFALSGISLPIAGAAGLLVSDLVQDTLSARSALAARWEEQNPGQNPWPPSFPDRTLRIAKAALDAAYETQDPDLSLQLAALLGALNRIVSMSEAELQLDPFTPEDSFPQPDEE